MPVSVLFQFFLPFSSTLFSKDRPLRNRVALCFIATLFKVPQNGSAINFFFFLFFFVVVVVVDDVITELKFKLYKVQSCFETLKLKYTRPALKKKMNGYAYL